MLSFLRSRGQSPVTPARGAELDTGVDTTMTTRTRAADPAPAPAPGTAPGAAGGDHPGLLRAALEYIEDRHWDIVPGAGVRRHEGVWSCSCGDPRCPAPGSHPAHHDWHKRISGQPSRAHAWWSAHPQSSILLPTGRVFDVLDVPEAAGCLALARLERTGANLGPVAATPTRRMYFLVLPNARAKVAQALAALGWGRAGLDLVCRGAGDYIVAPPSRMGTRGQAQWVRRPGEANRWLPDAEELLAPLAYACGQHR
jgi:Bifunctional DNA primase/polymerase, N-terminal